MGADSKKAAAAMSLLLVAIVLYMVVFTGEQSRGWFLELLIVWPALSIYWLREFWRWAVRKGFIILPVKKS